MLLVFQHRIFNMREKEMVMLMFLQFLLLLLMGMSQLESPAVEGAAFPKPHLAQVNCSDTCGNVTIPFPFGIGAGCFLDEWYEILCEVDNTIPQLKMLDLRVLNISLKELTFFPTDNAITVSYPIIYSGSGCKQNETHDLVSLQGSPFTFSSRNKFFAVGYETAILESDDDHSLVGCNTQCSGTNAHRISACDGYDCCQSTIPNGLQEFHVDLRQVNKSGAGGVQDCQFGFLAYEDWFRPNRTDLYSLQHGDYVPVLLDWGIYDASLPSSLGLDTVSEVGVTAVCQNTSYMNRSMTPLISCTRNYGYVGNPYIRHGCEGMKSPSRVLKVTSVPCFH